MSDHATAQMATRPVWPAEGLTRVPYWVYQDEAIYRREQERIFRGNTWNYLCLEAELPAPNTWRTTFVGDMPVVVTRDANGVLHAFENRCAHRGALLCLKDRGEAREFACIYHNWTYDLGGNLTAVAFRRGIRGQGGMPPDAKPESQAPAKLRVATFCGLVFGTLSEATPALEAFLGAEILPRIRRVMKEPVRLLGGYTQVLPNNWKLYAENVRDTYHASLLHSFYTTFRLSRLSQRGGVTVGAGGNSQATSVMIDKDDRDDAYEQAGMRAVRDGFRLEAPELLEEVDELGDGVAIQILSVFPTFVLHQIHNSLAVRQIVPKGAHRTELNWTYFGFASDDEAMTERRLKQANFAGPGGYVSMEDGAATGFVQRGAAGAADRASVVEMGGSGVGSQASRLTETGVRGFWQAWRREIGI